MIAENTASIIYPTIIIEHDGTRRLTNGKEPLPQGTIVTSDYKDFDNRRTGVGSRAFKIITKKGTLLYCIKPPTHANYQRTDRRSPIRMAADHLN